MYLHCRAKHRIALSLFLNLKVRWPVASSLGTQGAGAWGGLVVFSELLLAVRMSDSDHVESEAERQRRKAAKYKGQPLAAITFYKYLYRKDKKLLFRSIFFSYLLPVILELLP